jgi:hypothetical protein
MPCSSNVAISECAQDDYKILQTRDFGWCTRT